MSDDILHLKFDGMSKVVKLVNCNELFECLPGIFQNWSITKVQQPDINNPPVLNISCENNSYRIEGDWLEKPMLRTGCVNAICGLVAELIRAYVSEDPQLLCLHGAAAKIGGKLVVFPSRYRSGKSVLSACLASADVELFCDDVLPVSLNNGCGIAPGLAPRLRLPLPTGLRVKSRQFIDSHTGLTGEHYLYLALRQGQMARKGSQADIGAFVLLAREEGTSAAFEKITEAEVLAEVVWQNFAREAEAPRILEVLSQLVASSQYYRLRFDCAEDAVALIKQTFSQWPEVDDNRSQKFVDANRDMDKDIILLPGNYLRKTGISIVTVDNQSFLADAQGAAIHHLNIIGAAIWSLLVEPMRLNQIMEILHTAFPDVEEDLIRTDVVKLLNELKVKGLLLTANEADSSLPVSTDLKSISTGE